MSADIRPPGSGRRWKLPLAVGVAVWLALSAAGIAKAQVGGAADPRIKPLPPVSAYDPTPQHEAQLREFISDVLTFTLLHETGHMVFSQYNVPVGSRDTEESAADSFAAAVMTAQVGSGGNAQHNGLSSAARFWDALHRLQQSEPGRYGQYDWADEHAQDEQRAYKLACLLYGSNPQAFASIAQKFSLQKRRDTCIADAAKNKKDWLGIISLNLNPNAGKLFDGWTPHVAVLHHEVPKGLPNGLSARLSRKRQLVQTLGILDVVGRNLLQLKKTPHDAALELVQKALERGQAAKKAPGSFDVGSVDMRPVITPFLDHPADGDSLLAYNYTVVGDSCLNDKNEPMINAFWNSESRSITLCYGFVEWVEYIGRRLLAE
jgi:hypothetical protein